MVVQYFSTLKSGEDVMRRMVDSWWVMGRGDESRLSDLFENVCDFLDFIVICGY